MSSALFQPIRLRGLALENRIMVSPMCQYSAVDGSMTDWHFAHLGMLSNSGAALLCFEMTDVEPIGRITPGCSGLYSDANEAALRRVVEFCRANGQAKLAIQLAHAGRKASTAAPWDARKSLSPEESGWQPVAPSAIPMGDGELVPRALTLAEIRTLVAKFADSVRRADRIGFDAIELHAAHGYLMHEFLSPLSNRRDDEYGGSLANRMRFPLEVVAAMRAAWPAHKPLGVRVSCTDWVEGGWDIEQTVALARELKKLGCDWIDCSSGGLVKNQSIPAGPGYQVPFSERIRKDAGIVTIAIGMITEARQAENIIAEGKADMVALARGFLWDPRWAWHAAVQLGATAHIPPQYLRARPAGRADVLEAEDVLRKSQEEVRRFRAAMDSSADMVLLVDRATMRYVDFNETVCRVLGYSREELLNMGPENLLLHGQDLRPVLRDELERAHDELIANPGIHTGMRTTYRCKDGSLLPTELTRAALSSGNTHITVVIARDIRKQIATENALRESEERFRSLTELSSDIYWEQDEEFRFTSFSRAGTGKLSQTSADLFLGKKRWEQNYLNMSADDWAAHIAVLEAHQPFSDLELCRQDESGRKVWTSVSGEPVFDPFGAFKGYRGVGKDITERKQGEERIQHLASHDALTSLPNRVMFGEVLNLAIQNAQRYQRDFAVLFIDLDRFKVINDTLGHEAGDKLLKEMGTRLTDAVRSGDVVARLGGDEFVVLVQEVSERKQVEAVARKILSALIKPMFMQGQECRVTASIGICMYPADAQDEQSLMKNADIAMYRAKEEGKNTYKFYSGEINVHSFERMALENSLRRGLERSEFLLHYQAKLDLHTGKITGVEALVRWRHPEMGLVSPGQFIPLAEETGLIVPIGKWVLATACAQSVAWRREGLPPLRMAVNLSARQFADEDLVKDIAAALESTGLQADLLELDLTESIVIQNTERAGKVLAEIKKMGVRLAIDDFGVGYSSLTHLKRFSIDTLKVDRSFIRDIPQNLEDRAITEAIIAMGKSLNLTVVAEGVETLEQQTFLHDHACDEMQGYFFSKPISSDQFAELLRQRTRLQSSRGPALA